MANGIPFSTFPISGNLRTTDTSVGLRDGLNYRFLNTGVNDSNGLPLITYSQPTGPGAAVNYIDFLSAFNGSSPTISAKGTGADVDLDISAQGSGHVGFTGTGAIGVPFGTTAQQPTGFDGGLRYNTDTDFLEYWDAGTSAWVDIINGAALAGLTYVTNTNETADLPNSQNLSALSTGIVKVTTGTGILSSLSIPLIETNGGTAQSTYTLGDTLYASAANTLSKLAGNTAGTIKYLSQTGTGVVSAAPVWSSISGGDITGAALSKVDDTNVTLSLGGTPLTALLRAASITAGWTGTLSGARGGTGVNNGASTITVGGNTAFSGAFTFTGALTGNTSVTFPTSGTLSTSTGTVTSVATAGLATGGTITTTGTITVTAATQADMETGTSTTVVVVPGVVQNHPGVCKAWGFVTVSTGTPTLQSNYNLTSITDVGVGQITFTIATDFSSANWAPFVAVNQAGVGALISNYDDTHNAGQVNCTSANVAAVFADPAQWSFSGFGDQ